ncbi:hypothetical protein L915_17268 [Phytophthora nicotianae]|uniref:FAR1 domain-containing protein n=3 Tax=Phytophthora nicotianae TaxID=4792 RepID=W2FZW5_PHYNI|nr:hypothetical protein L915_17268 [Phytophthora nicotianae]
MDLRVRAAHKRPLAGAAALEESDSGESERSQDDVWLPTPAASGVDSAEDESSGALSVSDVPESTSSTSESSGPRRVLAASPNKVEFLSWEAFDQYLAAYSAQTFQVLRSRSNTTVSERNERIRKQQSKATPIPDSWVQYSRTFICTHAGSYKSQASKRPRQETRSKGCNAKASIDQSGLIGYSRLVDSANQTFAVRITRCQLEHNHRLHENSFRAHSSNRVVLNDGALQTVDVLRRYGVKKTGIVRFITDKSISNPNAQDVQNLVRKLKARESKDGPTSSEKRLKKWMKEFSEKPGNVGRIFLDDINEKQKPLVQHHVGSSNDGGCRL